MVTKIDPITDRATYDCVQSRVNRMIDKPVRTPEEEAEIDMLLDELQSFARKNFEFFKFKLDGVDEVVGKLDYTHLTLDELIPVFGGLERFVEYMTRRRNIDAETIDALVTQFDMDRDELEMPFRSPPGDRDISAEGQELCEDPVCCPPDYVDWRVELAESVQALTGVGRVLQDMRVSA